MNPVTVQHQSSVIVYDADTLSSAHPGLFDPDYWVAQGRLSGQAPGRGTSHFIETEAGPAVLRRYLRGGWAARFSRDRYWFHGYQNSRPLREFALLQSMSAAGLSVPQPLAAFCERQGPWYRGALLSRRIAPAEPLAMHLGDADFNWWQLGSRLRDFHQAGVAHADLNARNILVGPAADSGTAMAERAVWLIDFDRCSFTPGRPVAGQANLARLHRSLQKLWPPGLASLEQSWKALLGGYEQRLAGP